MMMIAHYCKVRSPRLHRIFFIGDLDPIILKIKVWGLLLITAIFILYFLCMELSHLSYKRTKNDMENNKNVDIENRTAKIHSYVIPLLLILLFMCYWLNKVVLAVLFWTIIFIMIFVIFCFYSIVYLVYAKKRIHQQQEQERQMAIEQRYRRESDEISYSSQNEESKNAGVDDSSDSSSNGVLNRLIQSMKKTFTIKHRNKNEIEACSICCEEFKERSIIIQLK